MLNGEDPDKQSPNNLTRQAEDESLQDEAESKVMVMKVIVVLESLFKLELRRNSLLLYVSLGYLMIRRAFKLRI